MTSNTTNSTTADLSAILDSWIADVMAGETGGKSKGNAEGKALGMLQTFASSEDSVLDITSIPADWTVTRKGRDADAPVTMREVYNIVSKAYNSMPEGTPLYVVTFSSDDDNVRVLNIAHAATDALNAHADVVRSRVLAHGRALNAQKSLGANAPASHVRAAQDRVNRTEARLNIAKQDAVRLLAQIQQDAE